MENHIRTYPLRPYRRLLTLDQVAERCTVHPRFIAHLRRVGLIDAAQGHRDLFPLEITARVQKILRLRQDLAINFNGIAVVLDLLEKVEVLEARLRRFDPV